MIDIEREIAWLLAQQYRGRARGLVTRSKDDCRAISDALRPFKVEFNQIPITPRHVREAIRLTHSFGRADEVNE